MRYLLLLTSLLAAPGCSEEPPDTGGDAAEATSVALPTAPGEPVARVGEGVITDAQVDAAFARMPRGSSPDDALEALIELELIAQEARRRGLHTRPAALRVQERALVQRFLEQTIEREAPPTEEAELRQYYDEIALDIPGLKPALVTVSHVLVSPSPEGEPADAEALAESIRERLEATEERSAETLDKLALEASARGPLVRAEHDLTFPREVPIPTDGGPPRYQRMVEPFTEAAFALSPEQPLSEVVQSRFGFHVIVLRRREPALRAPYERLRGALHELVQREKRRGHFEHGLRELFQSTSIRVDDEALQALAERLFAREDPN